MGQQYPQWKKSLAVMMAVIGMIGSLVGAFIVWEVCALLIARTPKGATDWVALAVLGVVELGLVACIGILMVLVRRLLKGRII